MTELSEIQVAMCKVIKECGFEGLNRVKLNSLFISRPPVSGIISGDASEVIWSEPNLGNWAIYLDGHTLTQDEYEAWVKQND